MEGFANLYNDIADIISGAGDNGLVPDVGRDWMACGLLHPVWKVRAPMVRGWIGPKCHLHIKREILATRVMFFTVGVMIAAWAPLVPLAKLRVGVDDAQLGLMLLGLGIGGLITMPLTGPMTAIWGYRRVILGMFCASVLILPTLVYFDGFWPMTIALAFYGGAIGSTDVAMNLQASEVEKLSGRPLMSNFHGMWSIGAFSGAASMSALLTVGVAPMIATIVISVLSAIVTLMVTSGVMPKQAKPWK